MAMRQPQMRQSNFELLRIICMLFIIGIHIMTQTDAGLLRIQAGINYVFLVLFGYGGRLVCNCYVMIGAFFLTERSFKAERLVKLWLEVFFYSILITIFCYVTNIGNANIVTLIQAFFPIFGRPVWFAAEYMCMLLLSPFMNRLLETNLEICRKILIIIGVLIIGCATLFPIEHTTPAFSELVWFCFLYLLVGYWKKRPRSFCQQGKKCWIMFGIIYIALCVTYMVFMNLGITIFEKIASYYMTHYETLLAFTCSVFLFYAMKNTNVPYNRCINAIGESTFAVYLIHQMPAFYPFLWNGIFHVNDYASTKFFICYMLLLEFILFMACMVVDSCRKLLFMHVIQDSRIYKEVIRKMNQFMELT